MIGRLSKVFAIMYCWYCASGLMVGVVLCATTLILAVALPVGCWAPSFSARAKAQRKILFLVGNNDNAILSITSQCLFVHRRLAFQILIKHLALANALSANKNSMVE